MFLRRVEFQETLLQIPALLVVHYLAGDARAGVFRHHDQIPSGQADVVCEPGPLLSQALFGHLYENLLAFSHEVRDGELVTPPRPAPPPLRPAHGCISWCPVLPDLFGGYHVGSVKETVLLDPNVNKAGLDGRFDIGNPSLVSVSDELFARVALNIELFEVVILKDGDPTLLFFLYVN